MRSRGWDQRRPRAARVKRTHRRRSILRVILAEQDRISLAGNAARGRCARRRARIVLKSFLILLLRPLPHPVHDPAKRATRSGITENLGKLGRSDCRSGSNRRETWRGKREREREKYKIVSSARPSPPSRHTSVRSRAGERLFFQLNAKFRGSVSASRRGRLEFFSISRFTSRRTPTTRPPPPPPITLSVLQSYRPMHRVVFSIKSIKFHVRASRVTKAARAYAVDRGKNNFPSRWFRALERNPDLPALDGEPGIIDRAPRYQRARVNVVA